MKRNIFSLLAAGAMVAGMLTSCSKEDTAALIGNNNYPADGMVRISTTLGDAQPLSRAEGTTTATYTGTNLSLSVDYGAADKYTRANIRWNNTSGTWAQDLTAVDPMLWKNATTAAKIYAFAPHVVGATDLTAVPFSVKEDQGADGAILASDLVGYKDEAFVPGSSLSKLSELNLAFTHRLSKLTVNLTYGNQYPEGARPTIKNLEVINTSPSATYNAQTLAATASATTGEIIAATVKADSYEAIVVPQKIAASTKLVRVTLSDGTKLAYTTPAAQLFDANKHYTLSLRVGKDKLEVGSVTVDKWGDGAEITGGEAELQPTVIELGSEVYTVNEGDLVLFKGNGSQTTGQIIINGTATVTLQDVNIKPSVPTSLPDKERNRVLSPIVIAGGTATIKLKGENTLASTEFKVDMGSASEPYSGAGIQLVNNNSHVVIEGEANASLTVSSQWGCAAIGGNLWAEVGNITIKNAKINASTTDNRTNGAGAAIGSGSTYYFGPNKVGCGVITIINSDINASVSSDGNEFSAVIGSGEASLEGEINRCEGINIHLQKGQTKDAFLNKLTGGTTSKVGAGGGGGTNSCGFINWYNSDGTSITE